MVSEAMGRGGSYQVFQTCPTSPASTEPPLAMGQQPRPSATKGPKDGGCSRGGRSLPYRGQGASPELPSTRGGRDK